MTKNVKIGLIAFGIIGTGVGAYFLFEYLKLKKAYSTELNTQQADSLIQQKTQNLDDTIIPDDVTNNADANKGTSVDDSTDTNIDTTNTDSTNLTTPTDATSSGTIDDLLNQPI